MKKYSLFILMVVIVFSCKKKKADDTPPANNTPVHMNSMSAKLNGVDWAMGNNAWSTGNNNQIYTFTGMVAQSTFKRMMSLTLTYTLGTVNLNISGPYYAIYTDTSGTFYTSKIGQLNITELDTFKYGIKKIKATFNFMTDTVSGKSYNVTSGVVDFIMP